MHTTNLRKVGGSVMLAVPPALLDQLQLQAGMPVGVFIDGDRLVIEPRPKPRYTLAELLAATDDGEPRPVDEREWVDAPLPAASCCEPGRYLPRGAGSGRRARAARASPGADRLPGGVQCGDEVAGCLAHHDWGGVRAPHRICRADYRHQDNRRGAVRPAPRAGSGGTPRQEGGHATTRADGRRAGQSGHLVRIAADTKAI